MPGNQGSASIVTHRKMSMLPLGRLEGHQAMLSVLGTSLVSYDRGLTVLVGFEVRNLDALMSTAFEASKVSRQHLALSARED
jgi:hypothetical protein